MIYSGLPVTALQPARRIATHVSKAFPASLLCTMLILLLAVSCGRDDSDDIPAFESLGFTGSLDAVRQRVLGVYELLQEKPLDAGRNGRMGMHLSAYDKNVAAEFFFRRARELAPDDYRWSYYLAHSLYQQGRPEEAVLNYREVLNIYPGHVNTRLELAGILLEVGDIEESRDLYQSFTNEFPEIVEGWLGLGKAYYRLGDHDAATVALRRARSVGPQFGEVRYALAMVLREIGDEDAATRELAAYERNRKNKTRTDAPLLKEIHALYIGYSSHYAMAVYHYGRTDYESAVNSFRATIRLNPSYGDAWAGLVSSQVRLNDLKAAGDTYQEALAKKVGYARLHLIYGQALLEARQVDAARDAIAQAIEQDPQYAEALSAMGELEMQSGNSVAAIAHYRRLLLVHPYDQRVQLSLAQALNSAGRFDEAAGLLERVKADSDIEKSLLLKELAIAYFGMGRKDEAIEVLQRAREAIMKIYHVDLEHTINRLLAEWQKERFE